MNINLSAFYIFTSVCALIGVITIVLNGYLIIVIARNKSLQVLENSFLVNLAALNVVGGFVRFGYLVMLIDYHNPHCIWLIALIAYVANACLFQVTVMTVDKYIQIVHPFVHVKICTKLYVSLITCCVYVGASVTAIVASFSFEKNDSMMCSVYFVYICINILSTALLNIRILHVSWKRKNQVHALQPKAVNVERVRGVKVLAVVVMFMFIFYIPGWVQMILKVALDLPIEMQENFALSSFLLWMMTPMLDGIAFLFCRQDIRKCAWKLIRCNRAWQQY